MKKNKFVFRVIAIAVIGVTSVLGVKMASAASRTVYSNSNYNLENGWHTSVNVNMPYKMWYVDSHATRIKNGSDYTTTIYSAHYNTATTTIVRVLKESGVSTLVSNYELIGQTGTGNLQLWNAAYESVNGQHTVQYPGWNGTLRYISQSS